MQEKKRNLTLLFGGVCEEHLGKDSFLAPYYLGKLLGYSVTIVYLHREDAPDWPEFVRGVKMVPLHIRGHENSAQTIRYQEYYRYIWKNAKEIDVLMRFFNIRISRNFALLYKLRNPRGKFYLKLDIDPYSISDIKQKQTEGISLIGRLKSFVQNTINSISIPYVDIVSCESMLAYQKLMSTQTLPACWYDKLVVVPNGFDEETLASLQMKERNFDEKKNIMITVGRLGTDQKNTSMLLRALGKVNLKDWTFFLIGPIEQSFQAEIKIFYEKYPNKQHSVIFTGVIYDKKELWGYYNISKVFVLTSVWESFALVFNEARRFRNYILSTPVGAACEIIDGKYGSILEHNNDESLADRIQCIIDGETNIDVYDNFDVQTLSWESCIKPIVEKLTISNK